MKRIVITALVAVLILSLAGCGNTSSTTDTPSTTQAQSTTEATPETTSEPALNFPADFVAQDENPTTVESAPEASKFDQIETIVYDYKDSSGYTFEVTLKISPWILYTDSEVLQSAWKEVGGNKSLPTLDDWNLTEYSGNLYANDYASFRAYMTDAYYSVGSISVRNKTDGWDFSADRPGSFHNGLTWHSDKMMTALAGYGFMNMVLYGNEKSFGNKILDIRASMTSNNWGPVPFCLLHAENIVPNYPEGQYHQEMEYGVLLYNGGEYHIPFYDDAPTIDYPEEDPADSAEETATAQTTDLADTISIVTNAINTGDYYNLMLLFDKGGFAAYWLIDDNWYSGTFTEARAIVGDFEKGAEYLRSKYPGFVADWEPRNGAPLTDDSLSEWIRNYGEFYNATGEQVENYLSTFNGFAPLDGTYHEDYLWVSDNGYCNYSIPVSDSEVSAIEIWLYPIDYGYAVFMVNKTM